jgi:hypothetical protein
VFAKVTEVKSARVRYLDVLRSEREMWIIKLIVSGPRAIPLSESRLRHIELL